MYTVKSFVIENELVRIELYACRSLYVMSLNLRWAYAHR